jgi:copper chaperone CopZ
MYELHVEGMSCNHCVSTVTRSVLAVDHAAQVKVDLATNRVRVESKADIDLIKNAVDEAGYPVIEAGVV